MKGANEIQQIYGNFIYIPTWDVGAKFIISERNINKCFLW